MLLPEHRNTTIRLYVYIVLFILFPAVKCNDVDPVIRILADMGLSFDCASKVNELGFDNQIRVAENVNLSMSS